MANDQQFRVYTKFIATRGVEEYRNTIPFFVESDDKILELGCEWGTTSKLLYDKCPNLISTDISKDCIERAKLMYPNITFMTLDVFNIKQAMEIGKSFTKIYMDISGLSSYRALLDVIALINMYAQVFTPEAIIIKSGSLKNFSNNLIQWKLC